MLLGPGSIVLKYFTNVNDFALNPLAVWLKIIISLVWLSGHAVATESCQGPATSLKLARRVVVAPGQCQACSLSFLPSDALAMPPKTQTRNKATWAQIALGCEPRRTPPPGQGGTPGMPAAASSGSLLPDPAAPKQRSAASATATGSARPAPSAAGKDAQPPSGKPKAAQEAAPASAAPKQPAAHAPGAAATAVTSHSQPATIKGDMLALRAHQTTSSRRAATSSGQGLAHRVRCSHGCPRTIARDDAWALQQHEMHCEALRAREANDPPSYWRSQRSGSNQDQPSHWQGQRWEDRRDWHDNDAGYWQQEGQRTTAGNAAGPGASPQLAHPPPSNELGTGKGCRGAAAKPAAAAAAAVARSCCAVAHHL